MIVVIFDMTILPGKREHFDEANAELTSIVREVDGFLSMDEFYTETSEKNDRVVINGFFADAAAVKQWRENPRHHELQRHLRDGILADYRLIVAPVEREYGLSNRAQAPQDFPEPAGR